MSPSYRRFLRHTVLFIFSIALIAIPTSHVFAQTGPQRSTTTNDSIFTGTFLLCIVGMYLVLIMVMFWVYNDATQRGTNGCLWALLVFFMGIPGIILYFLLRPKHQLVPCPHCGNPRSSGQTYCPYCGQPYYVFNPNMNPE